MIRYLVNQFHVADESIRMLMKNSKEISSLFEGAFFEGDEEKVQEIVEKEYDHCTQLSEVIPQAIYLVFELSSRGISVYGNGNNLTLDYVKNHIKLYQSNQREINVLEGILGTSNL